MVKFFVKKLRGDISGQLQALENEIKAYLQGKQVISVNTSIKHATESGEEPYIIVTVVTES